MYRLLGVMHVWLQKPSNYTSIPVTCSTSREPLKTSKINRIQQSPWRPATLLPPPPSYLLLAAAQPKGPLFTN